MLPQLLLQCLYPNISPRPGILQPPPRYRPCQSAQHQHYLDNKVVDGRAAYVWVGSISWSELAGAFGCEATLSVATRTWETASSSSKDCCLTGLESARWDKEDELKLLQCTHGVAVELCVAMEA